MSVPDIAMRARIMAEATRLFMAAGYNGISMREIAEAVGVSKAGLYYHFRDKEDLFLAILHDALARLGQIVQAARAAGPPARTQVELLVCALFGLPGEQRALIRLAGHELAHLGATARTEFGRQYHAQFIGQVSALLEAAIARGELRPIEPQTLTWLLLGMMYPFLTSDDGADARRPDQTIAALLELFFAGAAQPG